MADIKIASDSGKLYAGVDADLEIYSNGSHSYISNATAAHSIVLRTRASGGATADAVTIDADKNVTMTGTLGVTGAVTANAGVVVDNITIDGTEIDLSSGDLTIDVAGDINLDADGGDIVFKDGGTAIGSFWNANSGDFYIGSQVSDKDL